jgi:hypothetical protein
MTTTVELLAMVDLFVKTVGEALGAIVDISTCLTK